MKTKRRRGRIPTPRLPSSVEKIVIESKEMNQTIFGEFFVDYENNTITFKKIEVDEPDEE